MQKGLAHLSVKTVQTKKSFDPISPTKKVKSQKLVVQTLVPSLPSPNLKRGGEKPVIGGPDPRPYLPKPKPGEGGNKPDKDLFGSWLDKDGYITDGPKSRTGSTLMGITLTTVNRKALVCLRVKTPQNRNHVRFPPSLLSQYS